MANQWFRMYADFVNNPKLWNVPETFQLRYVKLMCLRSAGELLEMSTDQMAWALRLTTEEMAKTLDVLGVAGLWVEGDIYNWDKRQYNSDNSTSRTKKHREMKRSGNVPGTPSESDTDTDTDTEKNTESSSPKAANIDRVLDAQVAEVLSHFKATTGKSRVSTESTSNRKHVKARIKDGASVDDLKAIADLKTEQVKAGAFKDQYLRIETLYNETKCQSYLAELDSIRAGPVANQRTEQAASALREVLTEMEGERNGTSSRISGTPGGGDERTNGLHALEGIHRIASGD